MKDTAGNGPAYDSSTFDIDADTIPPSTCEITSPTEGEIINDGYFYVKGKAKDDFYPISYAVKTKPRPFVSNGWTTILSGELEQSDAEDGQGNAIEITFGRLDTTAISNGTYKLQLEITDGGGNVVTDEIECIVNSTLKVGQYTRTDPPDLSVAYSGELPFEFVRSYNSHNLSRGSLHYGWMHSYEASLYEDLSFSDPIWQQDSNGLLYGYAVVRLPEGGVWCSARPAAATASRTMTPRRG